MVPYVLITRVWSADPRKTWVWVLAGIYAVLLWEGCTDADGKGWEDVLHSLPNLGQALVLGAVAIAILALEVGCFRRIILGRDTVGWVGWLYIVANWLWHERRGFSRLRVGGHCGVSRAFNVHCTTPEHETISWWTGQSSHIR
jgi:hypothetical protein